MPSPVALESPRGIPESVLRSPWRTAVWTGVVAAILGAAGGICVSVLGWLPNAGVSGRPLSAIRAGLLAFLGAQHGGLTVDGTPTRFVPLGMTIAVGVVAWRAGAALADVLQLTEVDRPQRIGSVLAAQAGAYAVACTILVPFAALGTSTAPLLAVLVGAFVLFGCVSGAALLRLPVLAAVVEAKLSQPLRRGARAAAVAVAVYLGAGALLAAGSTAVHAGRVMDLTRLLGGGIGGFPIAIISLLCTPNAAVAGAAYLSGPGFAVGTGTHVGPLTTSHGTLPVFPLLGAMPTGHGATPIVLGWLALTLAGAGIAAAWWIVRGGARGALRAVAAAAAVAGVAMAVASWLAGGAVGTGRLHTVGPSPWQVGLAVAAEVGAISGVTVGGWLLWRWIGRRGEHLDGGRTGADLVKAGSPDR